MSKSNLKHTLNIFSIKHLALQLKIPVEELKYMATNQSKHFRKQRTIIYNDDGTIKKVRDTYSCDDRLEKILKSINLNLFKKIMLPNSMHGSTKGRSNITNARVHLGQPFIMNLDIKDFFPSISPNHVFNAIKDRLHCTTKVAKLLEKLCTADRHVPQGFNTSSSIANLVLVPAAKKMESLCEKIGLRITVLVDDITISGYKNPKNYEVKFDKILNDCGFQLHLDPKKRTCRSNKEKQKVTGVIVNRKLNIDKASYRDLRAKLFLCNKYGPAEFLKINKVTTKKGEHITNPLRLKSHLLGKLHYLKNFNPDKVVSIMNTYKEIQWEI